MVATNGRAAVTVKEAAEHLGITDRAVRLRIQKGTLKGQVIKGKWLIYLSEAPEARVPSEHFHTANGKEEAEAIRPTSNAETQLQQVMSAWVQPLVEKIGSLERAIGSLESEIRQKDLAIEQLTAALGDEEDENISRKAPRSRFWAAFFGR